jgi:hypothetical protein
MTNQLAFRASSLEIFENIILKKCALMIPNVDFVNLDYESPNKSPSVAQRLRDHKPKPSKLKIRESRQKKTSSMASTPETTAQVIKMSPLFSR